MREGEVRVRTGFGHLRFTQVSPEQWICEREYGGSIGSAYFLKDRGWFFRTNGTQDLTAGDTNEITYFLHTQNYERRKED